MASISRALRPLARGYATAAPKVTVPQVQLSGLSGKYATALFTAAAKRDEKSLAAVEKDVGGIQKLLAGKEGASTRAFLENPTLQSSDRKKGLDALMSKVQGPSDLTRNLFQVLAENGRLYEAEKVVESFMTLMSAHRGEVNVTITTAQPLESALQSRLETSLKKSTVAQGKTLKIKNVVNPAVLGGLLVDFGDKTIDLSVQSRVNRMNGLLNQSV